MEIKHWVVILYAWKTERSSNNAETYITLAGTSVNKMEILSRIKVHMTLAS
jgi:hypothetical protein